MTSFVFVNQCNDAGLTDAILAAMAAAIEVQLNRDVSPEWGGNYRVRAATSSSPPADGEVVAAILDNLPHAPGAIAFHNWVGAPLIYAARSMVDSYSDGGNSLSVALSHECIETIGDFGCNAWYDDAQGRECAGELCDAVEASWYYATGSVAVSDWLYRSFFQTGTVAPYSHCQALGGAGPPAPFMTAGGGYQIVRLSGTGETSITGVIRHDRMAKKLHPCSRTHRRGWRPKG